MSEEEAAAQEKRARRRRLAEVFGDDGPDQTRDDQPDPSERVSRERDDAWYRDQVPPHHG